MDCPLNKFRKLYAQANNTEVTLATVGKNMIPAARVVLLKHFDESGFVFYTNLTSLKAKQIDENANVALLFRWPSLYNQVRIEGTCSLVSEQEADEYFASRPRGSQIGAWASKQSQHLTSKEQLDSCVEIGKKKFASSEKIPRPKFWSGFRVLPTRWEFWSEGKDRLHERKVYVRNEEGWLPYMLFP